MALSAPLSPPATVPIEQHSVFHVRLIDPWRSSTTPVNQLQQQPPQQRNYSFFGLELELHGHHDKSPACQTLDFTTTSRPTQIEKLTSMKGPFRVIVVSKMPLESASDHQKPLLQATISIQIQNELTRINKVHFLKFCSTGADVYRGLARVLDNVSVARAYELTFLRHNHTQASAKIRPFAARADVQSAQVAQFQKLQSEELTWPEDRKKRKQFVLQQLDFHRETYLYTHIGGRLQQLHDEIMGGGQWHAYEFEKALWYYHAPRGELFAEHPMRNHEKTRELLGSVQLRTRLAARMIQTRVRLFLPCIRVVHTTTERLLESAVEEIWRHSAGTACAQAAKMEAAVLALQRRTRAKLQHSRVANTVAGRLLESAVDAIWGQCVADVGAQAAKKEAAVLALQRRSRVKFKRSHVANAVVGRLLASSVDEIWRQSVEVACAQAVQREAAIRKLQRRTRVTLKRRRLAKTVAERLLESSVEEIWRECVDVACAQTQAANAVAAVKKLQTTTTRAGQIKGVVGKWTQRNVIKSELPPPVMEPPVVEPEPGLREQERPATPKEPVKKTAVVPSPIVQVVELEAATPSPPVLPIEPELKPSTMDTLASVAVPEPQELVAESTELLIPQERPVGLSQRDHPVSRSVADCPPETTEPTQHVVTVHQDAMDTEYDSDSDTDAHWRSRLRLLKLHYKQRHLSPKTNTKQKPHPRKRREEISSVVVGCGPLSASLEPALYDRSSSLLLDGPLASGFLTSLKEPKQQATPSWRRDGSFRSFHDFFTSSSSVSAAYVYEDDYHDYHDHDYNRRAPAVAKARARSPVSPTKLPGLLAASSSSTLPPPVSLISGVKPKPHINVAAHPAASMANALPMTSSPPKKLPYIRRRKR